MAKNLIFTYNDANYTDANSWRGASLPHDSDVEYVPWSGIGNVSRRCKLLNS
jgi:hypothetical protein